MQQMQDNGRPDPKSKAFYNGRKASASGAQKRHRGGKSCAFVACGISLHELVERKEFTDSTLLAMSSNRGMMGTSSVSRIPPHLLFILVIVALFVMFSWYMAYESIVESLMEQISIVVMASPLLILLAVHWLSAVEKPTFPWPRSEPNAIHRASSSPWGVGMMLVFLTLMISYKSALQEQFFPLWRRA